MTAAPIANEVDGKTILVTGGTGTVGSAIVRHLLQREPRGIRIYSRDEHKQFELRERLPSDPRLRFLIGDTRDLHRLRSAVDGIDVIFHAAAMKHVLACEYNPFEAVKTNILGTQNVIDAALDAGVGRVILASSDKAVNPTSTMGASKLMAEKLVTAADTFRGERRTIFATVRFGNVVGSRGSVIPLFIEQAEASGPITLTDRRMTRFIMSIERAVELMLEVLRIARGGEVFVLKMPALRIEDLATVVRDEIAPVRDLHPDEIEIREIGGRPGEKLAEDLLTPDELSRSLETDTSYIVLPQLPELHPDRAPLEYEGAAPAKAALSSDQAKPLTREQLRELLVSYGVLGRS